MKSRNHRSSAKPIALAFGALVASGLMAFSPSFAFAESGDAAAGRTVFQRCTGCHSTSADKNGVGPSLAGVFGRKSASVAGFKYSPALKNANLTWNESTLDQFLKSPSADVHGTTMYVSVPNDADRRNVIAYLRTLSPGTTAAPAEKR
jgi:cytochrome c